MEGKLISREYEGKTFVVTGGGNGIGKNIVENLLCRGGNVCVVDLDTEKLGREQKWAEERMFLLHGDIAKEEVLQEFCDGVKSRFGEVFCLVNNACKSHGGIANNCSHSDFAKTLAVGVVAPYYLTKNLLDVFCEGASVVNISSVRHMQSQSGTESYSATKGGITSLTHALAVSLAGKVRVNSISPGWIDTTNSEFFGADNTQHLVGRVGKPQDISNLVMFLASEKASFITAQDFVCDGGMSKLLVYHGDEGWSLSERVL